ncbi:hypothetical protein ACHAPU_000617 [Fusarium lateritium]
MHCKTLGLFLAGVAVAAPGNAVNLFVADEAGSLTTLALTNTRHGFSLAATSQSSECQTVPSWLTLDSSNRVLYCLNRGQSPSETGSLNSFSIGTGGALKFVDRVQSPRDLVAGAIITGVNGERGYFSASYGPGTAAAYALGANGDLPGTGPLQQVATNISQTGPIADRQEASHLHHVIVDPTGKYVVTPDLGGDLCQVWSFNKKTISPIAKAGVLKAPVGAGPRHGFFKVMKNRDTFFFFNGELDQKIYSYRVKYEKTGLSFTKAFEIASLNAAFPPNTAPISEIAMSPDKRFLVVTNREKSFDTSIQAKSGPSDTLTTFLINEDGTLKPVQAAPSGGYLPRHFSFNKAGDKIAVGHRVNKTVVIWKRDVESGKIVPENQGGKLAQVTLTGGVMSTLWDE